MDGDAKAVRIAGGRQQFLGALGVVLDDLQVGIVAKQRGRYQVAGRLGQAFHHAFLDGFAVDRHRDRLQHALVLHRVFVKRLALFVGHEGRLVAAGVRVKKNHPVRDFGEQADAIVRAYPRQIRCRDVLDRLHIAGQQRGQPRRAVRDKAQRDLAPGRLLAPVAIIALQLDAVVAQEFDEFVGTGADHALAAGEVVASQALRGLFGHHVDRGQVGQQQRVGLLGGEPNGMRVHNFFVDDRLGVDVKLARAADDGGRPVYRPRHIFGGHLAAIVKLDAFAQLELPGQVVDQRPGLGQTGNDAAVGIHRDQRFEHVVGHVQIGK